VTCEPCTTCGGDSFETATCSSNSDTQCAPLSASCRANATYESVAPTATSDRVCTPCTFCDAGLFRAGGCDGNEDAFCQEWETCSVGQEYECLSPTGLRDRQCCPLSVCQEGTYEVIGPTTTSDRVCCVNGFGGNDCSEDVSACTLEACANGGTCTPVGADSFQCKCTPGYGGPTCAIVEDCLAIIFDTFEKTGTAADPCQNGGVCRSQPRPPYCQCPMGFTGPACEVEEVRTTTSTTSTVSTTTSQTTTSVRR
jgi:hypothetical protein